MCSEICNATSNRFEVLCKLKDSRECEIPLNMKLKVAKEWIEERPSTRKVASKETLENIIVAMPAGVSDRYKVVLRGTRSQYDVCHRSR